MNNPAPISSSNDKATWATTSPLLSRDTVPVRRLLCFNAVDRSRLVARQAGTRPKTIPVNSETPTVNARTRQFMLGSISVGKKPVCRSPIAASALLPQNAKSTPTRPPNAASKMLSVKSCRIKRQRPAPTASLKLISGPRNAARASNRFATLAQAISSTSPTMINSP